jgi:hypothetical protein
VLAFLVIKIEYCRALHQNAIPASCPPQISNFPPVDPMNPDRIPLPREFRRIHPERYRRECIREGSSPATTKPSISSVSPAFLPGTAQYVGMAVTHSKQTTEQFLPGARIACSRALNARNSRPTIKGCTPLPNTFRAATSARDVAFLTGSASQTEIAVTHSKQTTEQFLTGARTAQYRTLNTLTNGANA